MEFEPTTEGNSTPLLRAADRNGDHHSSADSLDMEEPVPTPKPHTPLLDHQSSVDHSAATGNSRLAGRSGDKSGGVVVMPDGSMVSIQRGAAGAASQTRSDLSSVERPLLQPATTSAAGGVTPPGVPYDSAQEAPLPLKQSSTTGPAPVSVPFSHHYPPYVHASAAPSTTQPPYSMIKAPSYPDTAIPPKPDSSQLAGPAPEPGTQYHGNPHPSHSLTPPPYHQQSALPPKDSAGPAPVPGRAPNHVPQKPGASGAGPAPDSTRQQPVVQQYTNPVQFTAMQPPIPPPQPVSFQQFPPSQYRPYQQPISGQFSSPYTVYQQPVPQPVLQKKPLKTSKSFKTETLDDNQYYISICLCITLTLLWNPLSLICCIPAFYFASKAAEENEKNNYEKALSHHRKAQYLNVGGFIFIVVSGLIFLTVVPIAAGITGALLSSSSTPSPDY